MDNCIIPFLLVLLLRKVTIMIGLIPTYRLPAEWEPQRGVLLTWPHEATDWLYCLDEITETFIQLADAITKVAQLTIATPEPEVVAAMLDSRLTPGQKAHIAYCHCPTNDTWARDHGPISLVAGTTQEEAQKYDPLRLDFQFNGKSKQKGEIILMNDGQTTLNITSLQMFTPGLKVTLSKRELKPGETAKLKITGIAKELKRARTKPRVLMITNDPDKPKVVITVNYAP